MFSRIKAKAAHNQPVIKQMKYPTSHIGSPLKITAIIA